MASPVSVLETTGDFFGNSRKRKADDELSKIEKFLMEDDDEYSDQGPEMTISMLENYLFRSGDDPVLVPVSGQAMSRGGGSDLLLPSPLKRQRKEQQQEVVEIIMLDSDDEEEEEECQNMIFNKEMMEKILMNDDDDDDEPETRNNPMAENQVGVFMEELNQLIRSGSDLGSRKSISSGGRCDLIVLDSDDEEEEERPNITTNQQQGAVNIDQEKEGEAFDCLNVESSSKPAKMKSLDDEQDDWHFYHQEIWVADNNEHEQQGGWIDGEDYNIPDDSFLDIRPMW